MIGKILASLGIDSDVALPTNQHPADSHNASAVKMVERALKRDLPRQRGPENLHQSIMRAVRKAGQPRVDVERLFLRRWGWQLAASAGTVALAVLGLWVLSTPSPKPVSKAGSVPPVGAAVALAEISTALEFGARIPMDLPAATVAPLEQELHHVNSDLRRAADFLLASVP